MLSNAGTACYNFTSNATIALNVPMAAFFNASMAGTDTCLMTVLFTYSTNRYAVAVLNADQSERTMPHDRVSILSYRFCFSLLHVCKGRGGEGGTGDRYSLNCSNGKSYLGALIFGLLGTSPSVSSPGGVGSSVLFQQNLYDVTMAIGSSFPTATISEVTNALAPQYNPAKFPVVGSNVYAGNLWLYCPCRGGEYGPMSGQCTACPQGTRSFSASAICRAQHTTNDRLFPSLPCKCPSVMAIVFNHDDCTVP